MPLRVTPIDEQARKLTIYGIDVWIKYQNSAIRLRQKREQLVSEMGLTEAEYGELPEEERDRIYGKAFVGTVVTGIEPFIVTDENGETIEFKYDAPSDVEGFDTMGEELLGCDVLLRDEILNRSVMIENFRVKREVEALGNSSRRSGSGKK